MSALVNNSTKILNTTYSSSLLIRILMANALLILSAKISIPFYPVPLSLQTLVIMGIALFAGRKVAMISTIAYLFEGVMGFPVFTSIETGSAVFLGTRGGYLFGFLILSYICSTSKRIFENEFLNSFVIQAFGLFFVYVLGVGYLATLIGFANAIQFGLIPFIFGAICKILLVSLAKNAY